MADAGRAMMLYRGMYDSTHTYEKLDVVNHNGSLYISTTDGNLGTEPTDGTKWKLFLQGGVADKIQATDTHGLVGEAGSSSFVQLLLDSLASRVGKDGNGNVISETYSTKNEMSVLNPFKFVYYIDSDITERISDIDSVEPYVFGHMENCPISSYLVFVVTYKYDDYTLQVCWGNGEMATRYYDKDGTWTNWKTGVNRSNILNTLEEIDANTSGENIAGAFAIKSLKSNFANSIEALNSDLATKISSFEYKLSANSSIDIEMSRGIYLLACKSNSNVHQSLHVMLFGDAAGTVEKIVGEDDLYMTFSVANNVLTITNTHPNYLVVLYLVPLTR